MNYQVEEWLVVALCCDAAPEFRAAHNLFSEAYSGPEQRQRIGHRLSKNSNRQRPVAAAKRLDIALAA